MDQAFDFGNANDEQRRAITTTEGPVLITAGLGTGKTFTLVKRVAYLILKKHVKPSTILVAIFTEKAAKELATRISTQHEEGPNHTRATMICMGSLKYTMRPYERDTLYDLDLDPHEQVNRINDPAYAEKVAQMRERLLTWYQETADWVPNCKDMR